MSFPQYERYKDSGVEWLGQVPEHWEVKPLKKLAKLTTGLTPSTDDTENYSNEDLAYPWIRPEDIDETGKPTVASKFLSEKGWRLTRIVKEKSSLICCIGTIGKVGFLEKNASTNQQITAATFLDSERFYYYATQAARTEFEIVSTGNVVRILNSERLGAICFMQPTLCERNAIAAFLDRETTKIDNLIAEQQRLIALLTEKRQAVISHAVTKGLNPDAPMKDSGVEWLGEVPEHWEVWKVSQAFKHVGSGTTPKSDNIAYYENGEISWLNTGDLNDSNLFSCEKKVTKLAVKEYSSLKTYDVGSIIIAMYGATIGKLAILQFSTTVNQACCVFSNSDVINNKFFFYWLLGLRQHIVSLATGGGQPNISQEILINIRLAVPNHKEQLNMITFLDNEVLKYDELISEAQKGISLLQERRSALISAAVTGKIDVRGVSG